MIIPTSLVDKYIKQDASIVRTNKPKDKKYFLDNCQGMVAIHVDGRGGIGYSDQGRYQMLRDFSGGKQSESRYKDYFSTDNTEPNPVAQRVSDVDGDGGFSQPLEGKRKGYMNIFWKVISPAPKLMSTLLGKFEQAEYDIKANPIDANSGAEVENKMLELWAIKENLAFLRTFNENMGVDFKEPDFMPETIDELKLFKERGGFKAEDAMFMEQLITWTTSVSHWKDIKKECTKDLIDLSIAACMDFYDPEDNTVKTKYVDPANLFIQASDCADFRDSEYAGHVYETTVSNLRFLLHNEGIEPTVYEPILQKCANDYCDLLGNPDSNQWGKYNTANEIGGWKYDFFKVLVADSFWIDTDEVRDLLSTNRYGKTKIYHKIDEKTKPKENEEIQSTLIRKRFRASWVIGTDIVYQYGVDKNITRPNKKDVLIPIHAYKLPWVSITDQCIPLYDNMAIIWDKYQNNIATSINKGYIFDWDSFIALDKAGQNNMKEILRQFIETGIGFAKRTTERGARNNNAQNPVQELEGGMGSAVTDFMNQLKLNLSMIENLTGLNPLSMGTVDNNAPVKTSEIAVQATSDTLRPILTGMLTLKESMAKNVVLAIQLLIQFDKDAQATYSEIIGKRGIEIMQIAEGNAVKYGIVLEAKPTQQERADLMESAKTALASGRNGQPGITEADYFAISSIVNYGGSLKLAEMWLETSIRKNKKLIADQAQANSQAQIQGQTQMQQAKVQIETQAALAIEQEKGKQARETLTTKAFYDALLQQDRVQAQATIEAMRGYISSGQLYIPPSDGQQPQQSGQQAPPQPQPQEQQMQMQQ